MTFEGKIGFLIEFATDNQAERIAELAIRALEELAAGWNNKIPDFAAAVRLFAKISDNTWFLARGGREAYRNLVDRLINQLDFATAEDWLSMIEFPDKALDWTKADEERFRKALNSYCASGVDDEIFDCTTVDELSNLRNFLGELVSEHGLDLEHALNSVEEKLAEAAGDETWETDTRRDFGGERSLRHKEEMSDVNVVEMFNTLRENISS